MAPKRLHVFASPDFPQVFDFQLDRIFALVDHSLAPQLGICCWESAETREGACNGIPCYQRAVVHHLESDLEFCLKHFPR